jgi:hypothetical protein
MRWRDPAAVYGTPVSCHEPPNVWIDKGSIPNMKTRYQNARERICALTSPDASPIGQLAKAASLAKRSAETGMPMLDCVPTPNRKKRVPRPAVAAARVAPAAPSSPLFTGVPRGLRAPRRRSPRQAAQAVSLEVNRPLAQATGLQAALSKMARFAVEIRHGFHAPGAAAHSPRQLLTGIDLFNEFWDCYPPTRDHSALPSLHASTLLAHLGTLFKLIDSLRIRAQQGHPPGPGFAECEQLWNEVDAKVAPHRDVWSNSLLPEQQAQLGEHFRLLNEVPAAAKAAARLRASLQIP